MYLRIRSPLLYLDRAPLSASHVAFASPNPSAAPRVHRPVRPSVRTPLINLLTAHWSTHRPHTHTHAHAQRMPRHHRPRLDVILRVPRHQPYTEKAASERRHLTSTSSSSSSSQLPTSLSSSSAAAAVNPTSDSDAVQAQVPLASSSSTSCAEWNSLLIWARRMRGPQWDSGVGMWMVDQGSDEYYA